MSVVLDLNPALFGAPPDDASCLCGRAAFCPVCGSYDPAVRDPEVLDAVTAAARPRPVARRVVRKRLDD